MNARLLAALLALAAGIAAVVLVIVLAARNSGASVRNEAIAPVRRHVAADLDHHLVTVAKRERARIAAHAHAIPKEGDSAVEAQQSPPPERLTPDREQLAERGRRDRASTTPVGSRVQT